jgi:hypothetical protein
MRSCVTSRLLSHYGMGAEILLSVRLPSFKHTRRITAHGGQKVACACFTDSSRARADGAGGSRAVEAMAVSTQSTAVFGARALSKYEGNRACGEIKCI